MSRSTVRINQAPGGSSSINLFGQSDSSISSGARKGHGRSSGGGSSSFNPFQHDGQGPVEKRRGNSYQGPTSYPPEMQQAPSTFPSQSCPSDQMPNYPNYNENPGQMATPNMGYQSYRNNEEYQYANQAYHQQNQQGHYMNGHLGAYPNQTPRQMSQTQEWSTPSNPMDPYGQTQTYQNAYAPQGYQQHVDMSGGPGFTPRSSSRGSTASSSGNRPSSQSSRSSLASAGAAHVFGHGKGGTPSYQQQQSHAYNEPHHPAQEANNYGHKGPVPPLRGFDQLSHDNGTARVDAMMPAGSAQSYALEQYGNQQQSNYYNSLQPQTYPNPYSDYQNPAKDSFNNFNQNPERQNHTKDFSSNHSNQPQSYQSGYSAQQNVFENNNMMQQASTWQGGPAGFGSAPNAFPSLSARNNIPMNNFGCQQGEAYSSASESIGQHQGQSNYHAPAAPNPLNGRRTQVSVKQPPGGRSQLTIG